MEGFFLRLHNRPDDAEQKFLEAWKLAKNNQSINRELASLYCKQQRYSEAEIYARSAYQDAPTNPYLIDILAETLLGKIQMGLPVDIKEVGKILGELKVYGDAPGSSFFLIRDAQRRARDRDFKGALASINRAVDRTPALPAPYFIRAEIHIALRDLPAAEVDISKINQLLTEAGGYSEGDEAHVHELDIKILLEKQQYQMAKQRIESSAFLPRTVEQRLLKQLARSIAFAPESADQSMREWAKKFGGPKSR